MPNLKLYLQSTNHCLADNVWLANTSWQRLRGLLGRKSLGAREAMWLRPCNSVHTMWMLFSIDAIFLDRNLRIVKLIENLRPFRFTLPCRAAHSVIEISAHTISQHQLRLGDQFALQRAMKTLQNE